MKTLELHEEGRRVLRLARAGKGKESRDALDLLIGKAIEHGREQATKTKKTKGARS